MAARYTHLLPVDRQRATEQRKDATMHPILTSGVALQS